MKLFNLEGKTALITGGTHGLGLAMAMGLAEAGAKIIINGHTPERLDQAVILCRERGFEVIGQLFDITDEKEVLRNLKVIKEEIGYVDILVNNAAMHLRKKLLDLSYDEFQKVLQLNLAAQFLMARELVKPMIKQGSGKIINICSMMSELGRETTGAYAAAKGGLKMLTRSMATEWAPFNIQVNGIGPGYIKTAATGPISEPGHPLHDFIVDRTPAGRWGTPDDLVGTAIYLASHASDFVNGHIVYVDGGILASLGRPSK